MKKEKKRVHCGGYYHTDIENTHGREREKVTHI